MRDRINRQEIKKYREITLKAFSMAKANVNPKRAKEAEEIIKIVDCYLQDSQHFENKDDLINAFGCIYYSHGWIDTGARLGIFEVKDNNLFVLP